jgi:heptaprenyl diphosphate synthase
VVEAAVVVELTHLATLYHDDVMDEADVRRGAQSANARWTNTVAILTGDFLFARRSDVVAGLGPEAVRIQARTFARLVEGQIAETAGPADGEDPVEHHLQVVADKTGSLIATSARLGAMLAGAPAADVETAARFGEVIGTAFQLSDDLIDVLSDADDTGKTPGTDLREGIRTLPVLLALAMDDAAGSGCATCCAATSPTTRGWPRRCRCCAPRPRSRPRAPGCRGACRRRATSRPPCPTPRRATPSSRSPTSSSSAPADAPAAPRLVR